MKKLSIILFLTLITIANSNTIKLSFITDDGDKGSDLTFGLHKDATFGLDEELGEIFTINAAPPSPYYLFNLLYFNDSTNTDINKRGTTWASKDYIPYPIENKLHIHSFRVWLDGGRKFTINWEINKDNIDSAKIQDENGGQFINIDLMSNDSYKWENELVPSLNLKLLVWYNTSKTSVKSTSEDIIIYPNPANNFINIDKEFSKGEIFNLEGVKVLDFYKKDVNISNLSAGTYFLKLFINDYVLTKKLIIE